MRSKCTAFVARWRGVMLMLVGCAAALWLGATGQLKLYIHPRYVIFTLVMTVIGLLLVILSFGYYRDDEPAKTKATKLQVLGAAGSCLICLLAVVGLLVVKPATLTTATVTQRGINSAATGNVQINNAVPLFGTGDYTSFKVKDWASLLAQTNDPSFYAGKSANITGFVSPDKDDPQHVFYVSRFVVTCCSVDARPIGVPVYAPNWQASHPVDSWMQVAGPFVANPSTKSQQRVAIQPSSITAIEQPKDPYVY